MWLFCFLFSIGFLIFALIFSLVFNKSAFAKKHKLSAFHFLSAGVFVSSIFTFVPTHLVTAEISVLGYVRAVLLSVFNSMQVFAFGCEFGNVVNSMVHCPMWLNMIYQVWIAFLFVIAPIFTFGFVLSLFKNVSAYLKYLGSYFKDVYVFSELNEKSLVLASDIKSHHNRAAIVFTDVFEGNEEKIYELTDQARSLGAICFKKDILVVNFKNHSENRPISFFAIGNNETENLNQSLKLIENYRDRDNTHLFIFSKKIESELLLTAIDKGSVKVRRINEVQSLVNRTLYRRGNIIFESAKELPCGNKKISAIVVGMGCHGTEMVKALTWFGQMDGYKLEINAFDQDPLAKEKFIALAPELMSPDYNGVEVEGEAQYKITVHSGIDVATTTFANEISKIDDATYVMVALGDDDVNINAAVNLRMYFERLGIHPVIQAIVYNAQQKKALEGIKNYRGQAYGIEFIGDMESSYTEEVIIDSELEEEALKRHLKWGEEEEFWTYEYNYRSSMASAIHMKARMECSIPGADKKEEELSGEERNVIEALEHRRWNAYMRSEGYVFSGSKEKTSRNDLAKMHHDLVDFSSLTEEEKRKDSKVGTN
ncbi:MAG: hypothetical protein IKJ74_04300 [Clostridia bacterium]|nr:hypothetical protein [Clostridia bacterium]